MKKLVFLEEIKAVYYLPASRSGITAGMNSMGNILAELSQNRVRINRTIQLPSIPEPLADYYQAITSIRKRSRRGYVDVVKKMEQEILGGTVRFDSRKKALVYRANDMDEELDMSDASSMVAEISPITAFLKYIITRHPERVRDGSAKIESPKSILFIEEPEAHLHPENQVKLIECLTELLDRQVILIISSHSNYILNKLNNLVLSEKLNLANYEALLMKRKGNGKNVTEKMRMDEFGVEDVNFADTASALYEEREDLVLKYMERHYGDDS